MWCTFQTHFSIGKRHFQNMFLKLKQFHSLSSFISHIAYIEVWMFRFYKTMLNVKFRLQEQNLKNILIFFHYHLNLFICCKTKLKKKFIFYRMSLSYRMIFFTEWIFFLTELNFLKGDTNIYFKQTTLFEKIYIFLLRKIKFL